MRTDYSQVFQSNAAVSKYDEVQYAPDSQASAVNTRQRRYLRRLVRDAFPNQRPVQHDFACGTGRAIELLHGLVRDAHGYDSSQHMIDRARANGRHAHWHVVRPDGPPPSPIPTTGVSVVTVFRLLLNVDERVRDRAMTFAANALPTYTSGLLVLQNHGHFRSLRHLRARHHADNPWFSELTDEQVADLLDRHGFTLVGRRGFALFPRGWYRLRAIRPLIRAIDDALCITRLFDRWAVDVLYVARRNRPVAPPEPDQPVIDCAGPDANA